MVFDDGDRDVIVHFAHPYASAHYDVLRPLPALSLALSLSLCRPSLITILSFVLVGIGVVFGSEVECPQCHGKAVITAFLMVGA